MLYVICCMSLQEFELEDVIHAPFIVKHFRPDLIKSLLSCLVPSKVR